MANYQLKTLLLFIVFFIKANHVYAQFENSEHYQIYAINLPEKINFAGEATPLNELNIRERLDQELLISQKQEYNDKKDLYSSKPCKT